jgi:anti-sigma B factor antagonist
MRFEEEQRGGHTVLRVEGSLRVGETARALAERLERIETDRKGALVLDMTGLEYLDSTAVGVLVGSFRRLHEERRDFVLVNPRDRIASLLRVTHLDSLFRIYGSLAEALGALSAGEGEDTGGG